MGPQGAADRRLKTTVVGKALLRSDGLNPSQGFQRQVELEPVDTELSFPRAGAGQGKAELTPV